MQRGARSPLASLSPRGEFGAQVDFAELAAMSDADFAVCTNYFRQLKAKMPLPLEPEIGERMPISKAYGARSRKFLHKLRYDMPKDAEGKELRCGLTLFRFDLFMRFVEAAMYLDVPEAKDAKEERAVQIEMGQRAEKLYREFSAAKSTSYENAAQIRRVAARVVWGSRDSLRDFLALVDLSDAATRASIRALAPPPKSERKEAMAAAAAATAAAPAPAPAPVAPAADLKDQTAASKV